MLIEGEAPSINVQITESVSEEVLDKLKKLGIDKKKVIVLKDTRSTERKVESSRINRFFISK